MWTNLGTFALVLDAATASALDRSAIVLTATAVLCVLLALFRRNVPEAKAVWAPLFVIVGLASVAGPLALRGRGTPPVLEARPIDAAFDLARTEPSARVTVIAIDAGSLDLITGAAAEGRLPNFGRILDAGAVRHLATLRPTSAETVWAAVATGKLPQKNGVRSATIYRLVRWRRGDPAAARLLLRARARTVRLSGRAAAHLGDAAHADLVEHPQHQRLLRRRRRLAADAAGAGRPRLSGQRRVSSRRADAVRHRRRLHACIRPISGPMRSPRWRAWPTRRRRSCRRRRSTCATRRRRGPIASTTASRRRWRARGRRR